MLKLHTKPFIILIFCCFYLSSAFAQVNVLDESTRQAEWSKIYSKYEGNLPQFQFNLEDPDFSVFAMNYEDLEGVAKNGKFELGIALPQALRDQIAAFVSGQSTENRLNPFDPQDISVEATFSHLKTDGTLFTDRAFGFYFENFRRNSDLKTWSRIDSQDSTVFRIRYAPRFEGVWKCSILIRVPNQQEMIATKDFYFKVVDRGLPGFVKISDNKHYLELDNALFLPFGMNMPTQGGTVTGYDRNGANPADYVGYFSSLRDLKESGANYFRYLCTPWTTEIEFEHLGNYTKRLPQAWEMDQLIEEIETLDLRMHFNMSYTTPLTYTGVFSLFWWDWTSAADMTNKCAAVPNWLDGDNGYCYHSDSTYGVQSIDEFLSNAESIRFYQNRLRYMISRWGYSTHIVGIELMNEINFSGVRYGLKDDCSVDPESYEHKPYFNDLSYVKKLSDWQIEMSRFIKEDLGHEEHPICANYGGTPNYVDSSNYHFDQEDGISLLGGDNTYFSKYIDIISYNDYYRWCEKFEYQSKDLVKLKNFRKNRRGLWLMDDKPLMHSEIGMGMHGCDDQFTFKQLYVMSPFSGGLGAVLPWHYNNNMPDYDSTEQRLDAWSIMPVVSDFFSDVPLHEGEWESGFYLREDKRVEMLFLTEGSSSADRAVAVINNRTVNRYTMRENWCDENPNKCDCYLSEIDLENFPEVYQTPRTCEWKEDKEFGGTEPLKISGMKYNNKYRIVYYDALTGAFVSEDIKRSNTFGQLKIKYPKLARTPKAGRGDLNGSMLLVKIYNANLGSFSDAHLR